MDRHDVPGTSAAEVAAAHEMDLGVQTAYGVRYLTYWFDADLGSLFCLAEGPNMEAVDEVHRKGHGFAASKIIEVEHAPIDAFFAPLPDHPAGRGIHRISDTSHPVHRHLRFDRADATIR